ncbi:DUF4026 domain-containing protein [Citrobacter europaeus]|uniref:DUF4026 domain-containing protein n=1 Tax=Citrobacter europaeus TaxID=1914243 RepID=UPI0019021400|nr:DUF4026 domain-containing protein [Citrobacter europaeus]MBJ8825740.1 DUF4026 domain-containing protein [Citrobacter freundii]MDT7083579.1 DUF4026 domain-containing protein [Citrobacter europaeus]
MASNKQAYLAAANNGLFKTDSEFVATPPQPVTLEALQARVEGQTLFPELLSRIDEEKEELHLTFTAGGELYLYRVSLFSCEHDPSALEYVPGARSVAPEVLSEMAEYRQRISVTTRFSNDVFLSWQQAIKIVGLLVPNLLVAQDASAGGRLFSRERLLFEARFPARPRADTLYAIHAVHDDENDHYWLHTHGLRRLGLPECEVIIHQPVENLGSIGYMIEAFVNICIDDRGMYCNEPLMLARTHEGEQYIVAIPWEQGLSVIEHGGNLNLLPEIAERVGDISDLPSGRFSGDLADREDEHNGPSCLLFRLADERGGIGSVIDGGLGGDQVMFMKSIALSDSDAQKAQMRWPYFQHIFETQHNEISAPLVKIGVPYGDDDKREHMWFMLQNIADEHLTGVLTNQPYYVHHMQEGEQYTLPFTLLSDWRIYHPRGVFTPDNIFELISHSS